MNIEATNINKTTDPQSAKNNSSKNNESSVKFADELKESSKTKTEQEEKTEPKTKAEAEPEKVVQEGSEEQTNKIDTEELKHTENFKENPLENDKNKEKLDNALNGLNSIVKEFNQSEDKLSGTLKNNEDLVDNSVMINKDFNIPENKDLMPQMNPNMNFSGDGQPFSSFMNNNSSQNNNNSALNTSAQDLAEEAAILSTMAENIAIANRNQALKDTRTISNEEGVKKVDTSTGIKIENIVKYDSIIMNQADVEVFVNLVENKEVSLDNLAPKSAEKSIQVSKTLANLLARAMENNQPIRIDFDNNISVIIKISRDGKISADFLPSSQVAEAYLKENLPLLRQRFDDENIKYDSLNQRERKDSNKDNNKKKDRNNE